MEQAPKILAAELTDDLHALPVQSENDAAIKQLLVENLKRGWETFDLELLQNGLSADFEFRYVVDDALSFRQTREEYLAKRLRWIKGTNAGSRRLLISKPVVVRPMDGGPVNEIYVSGFTTYMSKYFNPMFFATYVFTKSEARWLLKREIAIALYPKSPELHEIEILVGEPRKDRPEHLEAHEIMNLKGADTVVNSYTAKLYDKTFPADGQHKTVLVLFREPPKNGSTVVVDHFYQWTGGSNTYRYSIKAAGGDPWFFIVNSTWLRPPGGEVTFTVSIDGTPVKEKSYSAR